MSNRNNKNIGLFVLALVFCCSCLRDSKIRERKLIAASIMAVGESEYQMVYKNMCDTVRMWALNNLGYYRFLGREKNYFLDSLLCFNSDGTRMVTCVLMQQIALDGDADEMDIFYGEKIDGLWYFYEGANFFLPRSLFAGHDIHQPLNYKQLHSRALRDVFSGYLNRKGEINEEWFTSQFEGPGWGGLEDQHVVDWCFKGKRYTNLKDFYIASHLCKVKGNWLQRDTTQPIIPLPEKSNNP